MFLQQVRRLQALLHRCEEFASNPEILEPTVELDEVNTSGGEDNSPFKYLKTLGPQSSLHSFQIFNLDSYLVVVYADCSLCLAILILQDCTTCRHERFGETGPGRRW